MALLIYNKNKAGAIIATHMLYLSSNFLLHEMSCKKESIKYLAELTVF